MTPRGAVTSRVVCLPLVLLIACKGGDDTDGGNGAFGALANPVVDWLEDGDGPENELPLEPMRTGLVGRTGDGELRWTGVVDAGRDDVRVMEVDGSVYGYGMGMYRHTSEGVVVHALDAHLHPDVWPILLVPDDVAVGKTWTSEYGGEQGFRNQEQVIGHSVVNLPIGPASVWGIGEYQGESLYATRWYGEGIGRVEIAVGVQPQWSDGVGFTSMVVPDEDVVNAELALDPSPVAPWTDPFGHYVDPGTEPEVLAAWTHDGKTAFTWYGYIPAQCMYCSSVFPVSCVLDDNGVPWPLVDSCPVTDGLSPHSQDRTLDDLRAQLGFERGAAFAWTSGDEPRYLMIYNDLATVATGTPSASPTLLDDGAVLRGLWVHPDAPTSYAGLRFLGPTHTEPGEPLRLAAVGPDDRVYALTIDGDAITEFRPIGMLPGAVGFEITDGALTATSVTTDGRLFRLRFDGGPHIESLGDFWLQDDTAAYVYRTVVTDPNDPYVVYVGVMPYPLDTDGDGSWDTTPRFGMTLLRVTLQRDPIPHTLAPSLLLGFGDALGDPLLCWPPTDEPLETSGWTLQGRPATVYGPGGPDDNCALIVGDGVDDPRWAGAENAVHGPIPGIGPARVGFPLAESVPLFDLANAAVTVSGAESRNGLVLDEHGIPLTRLAKDWPDGMVMRDLAGKGYYLRGRFADHQVLHGTDLPEPSCTDCQYFGLAIGGGLVIQELSDPNTPAFVLRSTGETPVTNAQKDTLRATPGLAQDYVAARDGTLCAPTSSAWVCVDPSGTLASTPVYAQSWWGLDDGTVVIVGTPDGLWPWHTYALDPADMQLRLIDDRPINGFAPDRDGHAYAVARGPTDASSQWPHTLVEVTSTGLVEVMELGVSADETVPFLPLEDQFLFTNRRVPR